MHGVQLQSLFGDFIVRAKAAASNQISITSSLRPHFLTSAHQKVVWDRRIKQIWLRLRSVESSMDAAPVAADLDGAEMKVAGIYEMKVKIDESAAGKEDPADHAVAQQVQESIKKSPGRGKRRKKKEPETTSEGFVSLEKQSKALRIAAQLDEIYPNPSIPLDSRSNYQMLVATMLSARTTDKAVNKCTPALFAAAPDALAMSALEVSEIKEYIKNIGLSPAKSKNLHALSKMIVEKFDGVVPDNFADLESLPGVGHKTASVVMTQVFGKPAFPVDTHIHRLAERWGLSTGKNVEQTEADLKAVFPKESWAKVHLQIIYFGREHCAAIKHKKDQCPICSWADDRREPAAPKIPKAKTQKTKPSLRGTTKKKTAAVEETERKPKKIRKRS